MAAQALFGYELRGGVPLRRARTGPGSLGWLRLDASGSGLLSHAGELVCSVDSPAARITIWRGGVGVLVSCSLTGNYLLDTQRRSVTFDGSPGGEAWEHRLVSTILPLLLAELGELALHACAVVAPSGAILFCGPSGRGKSTLAAALAARGHAVLAEDVTVIADVAGGPVAWPGPAGVVVAGSVLDTLGASAGDFDSWEMRDPRRRSVHFATRPVEDPQPHVVCAVILLSERVDDHRREPGALEPVSPVGALPALMPSTVCAGVSQRREVMHRLARLVERVPVYRVALENQLALVADQAEAVLRDVSDSSDQASRAI